MLSVVHLVLLIVAVVLFLLVAVNINGGRLNLTALGLAFFAAAFAVPS